MEGFLLERTPMTAASERVIVRGCFLFGAVVLVLSVVLSSSFVHVASASASVNRHSMAIGISSDGTPIYDNIYWKGGWIIAEFSTEDEEAYVRMNITLDERMTIAAQWRFPNGSIYQMDEKTRDEGTHNVWFSISIKGYPPAQFLGRWEAEVFADGTPLFTEEFRISQAPTYPWNTILTMAGVAVLAIATPILWVFFGMKKPPPKLGFALSLVGGLMIAICGFFRGALGGSTYVMGTGAAVVTVFFYFIVPIFPGIAISISAVKRKGVAVLVFSCLVLSVISIYYVNTLMQGSDVRLNILPLILAVAGSVCGILGGLLIRRKT